MYPRQRTDSAFESDKDACAGSVSSSSSDSSLPWDQKTKTSGRKMGDQSTSTRARSTRPQNCWRGYVHDIVHSAWFDGIMLVVILVNAWHIGFEQSLELSGDLLAARWVEDLEHVFLIIYILELSLRASSDGLHYFLNGWGFFDSSLVFLGIMHKWVLEPFVGEGFGAVMVLRTCRVFRLTKTVRFLIMFKELWMLVRGLLTAIKTMIYTLLMLTIMLYIFSTIGIEVITKNGSMREDPELREHIDTHFGSIPEAMLTLLQFVTLDSMNLIYVPLVRHSWVLAVYFIAIILSVSIALMNLITAVIVNSAMEEALADKEIRQMNEDLQKRKMMKQLRSLFLRLDEDNSGEVTLEEIGGISAEEVSELNEVLGIKDPVEIFKLLDVDGSGALGIDEFCEGIWEVAENSGKLELKILRKSVMGLSKKVDKVFDKMSHHAHKQKHRRASSESSKTPPAGASPSANHYEERSAHASFQESGQLHNDLYSPAGTILEDETSVPVWAKDLGASLQKQVEELKLGVLMSLDSKFRENGSSPDSIELLQRMLSIKAQAFGDPTQSAPTSDEGRELPRVGSLPKFPSSSSYTAGPNKPSPSSKETAVKLRQSAQQGPVIQEADPTSPPPTSPMDHDWTQAIGRLSTQGSLCSHSQTLTGPRLNSNGSMASGVFLASNGSVTSGLLATGGLGTRGPDKPREPKASQRQVHL
mmetsp:Transcript_7817/g.17321  ORF Transcript_7817/g.17321 Transcript_7817/m.17321 type:complete len:700 (+) Transcript_7817:70-2169(+)